MTAGRPFILDHPNPLLTKRIDILKEVALTLIRHSLSACHLTVTEFTEMGNSLMRLAWASNHETGSTLSLGAKGFPSYDNSIGRSGRRAHAERSGCPFDAIHGDLNWPPIEYGSLVSGVSRAHLQAPVICLNQIKQVVCSIQEENLSSIRSEMIRAASSL